MAEMIVGVVILFGALFVVCKVLGTVARFCGLDEVMELMGEALSLSSGDFSSSREK